MLNRTAMFAAIGLLVIVFVGGVMYLFDLRFQRGDIYPPYSTFRSDPLGASAFYESLDRVPGLSARRYLEQTFKESDGRDRTLMVLGLDPWRLPDMTRTEFATVQQFALNGGRIVMTFAPDVNQYEPYIGPRDHSGKKDKSLDLRPPSERKPEVKKEDAKGKTDVKGTNSPAGGKVGKDSNQPDSQPPDDDSDDDRRSRANYADPEAEWGVHLNYHHLDTNDDGNIQFPTARLQGSVTGLPGSLKFHTDAYFDGLSNGWSTVYQRDNLPVVVERRLGKGSLLLVADSYWFSNEAMLKDPQTGLLAWVIGGGRDIIFDEAHLGVAVDPGIASLMRKYHLHGMILSLLLLAGLFIWKNTASLVPPYESGETAAPVAGRDAMAGFVNLLRRGIPRGRILDQIYEEWRKTGHRSTGAARRQEVESLMQNEAALPAEERHPAAIYRAISTALHRRH